jgi:hypothetical protein
MPARRFPPPWSVEELDACCLVAQFAAPAAPRVDVLIHKILFHVGHEDAEAWKVVILNNEHDAQMIVPFSVSHAFKAQHRRIE